jgi:ketosteroid isomerase-like protein
MDNHPNTEVVRRYLESMSGYDTESGTALLADDVEWHEIGNPEPIHGTAALRERYSGAEKPEWEITDGDVHDVIGGDDHVVALLSAHAVWGDKSIDYRVAEIYHVKDGKITARWAFSDDTQAINDFFKGT